VGEVKGRQKRKRAQSRNDWVGYDWERGEFVIKGRGKERRENEGVGIGRAEVV